MKKVFLSLLMLMLASAAWAVDIVFDATVDVGNGSSTAGEFTMIKDGIIVHVEQGVANGTHYRFYKNKKVTISSEIGPMDQIVFDCVSAGDEQYGSGGFTVDIGTYIPQGKQGVGAGNSDVVVFTASNFQVRATKIIVTVGEVAGLSAPYIAPASGTYYGPVEVSMMCITGGAKIYYTVDGSDPTTSSTEYTAPFMINETSTVKAISVKDDVVSEVVTASYSIEPPSNICLGDLDGLSDGEVVAFNHEATVLYQYNQYLYLKDECGYGQVYGSTGQTYSTGDIIPPGWGGTKMTYKGQVELGRPTGFQPATRNENIQPEPITIPMMGENTWAHYVILNDVIIDTVHQLLIDLDGNSCRYSPQLSNSYVMEPQSVIGIVTSYQYGDTMAYGLLIIEEMILPPPPIVCCLPDLYELNKGEVAQFECPLTVIYHNGRYLYVKDSCGNYGLIYGSNVGGPFENGDQIIGQASWTEYQRMKQLTNDGEWTKIGKTNPVEPIVLAVEELSTEMAHWFVKLVGVNLVLADDDYTYADDGTDRIIMFNKFNVEVTEVGNGGGNLHPDASVDPNQDNEVNIADVWELINRILTDRTTPEWVGGDGTYDITGFVAVYNNKLEIYPIKIEHHGGQYVLIGDVNGDGEVNIADVNCIINLILWN